MGRRCRHNAHTRPMMHERFSEGSAASRFVDPCRPISTLTIKGKGIVGIELHKALRSEGVVVKTVRPGCLAHKAGVEIGDVILAIDGRDIISDTVLAASILQGHHSKKRASVIEYLKAADAQEPHTNEAADALLALAWETANMPNEPSVTSNTAALERARIAKERTRSVTRSGISKQGSRQRLVMAN